MYNINYLKENFPSIPLEKWKYLYGINFNLSNNNDIKLYFFNSSFDYLYKYTTSELFKQYNHSSVCFNLHALSKIFDHRINLDSVMIDSYDPITETYYLFMENCNIRPYTDILIFLITRSEINNADFMDKVNHLNSTSIKTIEACHANNCISFIKISPSERSFKIYSKPFKYNHFEIPLELKKTLLNVLSCKKNQLMEALSDSGNAYDFKDGRTLLYTKNNELKFYKKIIQ